MQNANKKRAKLLGTNALPNEYILYISTIIKRGMNLNTFDEHKHIENYSYTFDELRTQSHELRTLAMNTKPSNSNIR